MTWTIPEITDEQASLLPFPEAQRYFSGSAAVATYEAMTCGWHGSSFDVHPGAVGVVQSGGALADLVGERVRVVAQGLRVERSVIVYVHNEGDTFEDISLTRRAFAALASLATDTLNVRVEVLS